MRALFTKLVQLFEEYDSINYSFDVPKNHDAEASAFNVMCVVNHIRDAMLFQPRENNSDSQLESDDKKLEINNKKLSEKLQLALKEHDINVYNDFGSIFIVKKNSWDYFVSLKQKTDILGLCKSKSKSAFFSFSLKNAKNENISFYGNGCSKTEGLASFAKHYMMYEDMCLLADEIGLGKTRIQLKVVFG